MNKSLETIALYYAPESSQGLTIKAPERGLSARLRGHSDIADNPDFVRRRKAQVLQPVQHYDFLSIKYFFPIHEDWGNTEKSTQPVDFSQKRKKKTRVSATCGCGNHEMNNPHTGAVSNPVTNEWKNEQTKHSKGRRDGKNQNIKNHPERRSPWVKKQLLPGRITPTTHGKAAPRYQPVVRTATPPHSRKTEWGCICGAIQHLAESPRVLGKMSDLGKRKLLPVNLGYFETVNTWSLLGPCVIGQRIDLSWKNQGRQCGKSSEPLPT
jgi:hypothetical protein